MSAGRGIPSWPPVLSSLAVILYLVWAFTSGPLRSQQPSTHNVTTTTTSIHLPPATTTTPTTVQIVPLPPSNTICATGALCTPQPSFAPAP